MSQVYHLFFVFVFVVFSVCSNCSEIWGLSTPNTIEQWDTSGLYNYPDQTRWLSQLLCIQLWCGRVVIIVLEVTVAENILFLVNPSPLPLLPGHIMYHSSSSTSPVFCPSHHHLLFAVQSDPWTAVSRSPTGRAFPMLSTAVCGDGQTFTATTSCVPLRPVSMPFTSRRTKSASTLTTTRGWRPQVSQIMPFECEKL